MAGAAASIGCPKTAETALSRNAVSVQVEASPAEAHAPVHRTSRVPPRALARSVIVSPGLTRREHHPNRPPHAIRSAVMTPPSAGCTVIDATVPVARLPLIQSRSTGPSIPAILPVADHCQTV
jgi:hypothetical protein